MLCVKRESKTSVLPAYQMARRLFFATLLLSTVAKAQMSPPPALRFDVVSIRPNHSGESRGVLAIPPDGNHLLVTNVPMNRILAFAFDRQRNDLILGLPAWATEERWDIEAKVAAADLPAFHALTFVQRKAMLQPILLERCRMEVHAGTKEAPVYALVLAKSGTRMREQTHPLSADPSPDWDLNQKHGEVHARAVPIAALLYVLNGASLDRQILDQTGLTGLYDFDLLWTSQDELNAHAASKEAGVDSREPLSPSIFAALPEQLGLRLEPTRAVVDALVVDHIERPTSN